MAKDREKFDLGAFDDEFVKNLGAWIVVSRPLGKGRQDFFFSHGIYMLATEHVNLKYMKNTPTSGKVILSFNATKILSGEDSMSDSLNTRKLESFIMEELRPYVDLERFPEYRKWIPCLDETNRDIIGNEDVIKELFSLIGTLDLPRYKKDLTYFENGTIYYFTGNTRESSEILIKIYIKDEERKARGQSYTANGCGLNLGEKCLRFEIVRQKKALQRRIESIRKKGNNLRFKSRSEIAVSDDFQIINIDELIEALGFSRIFTMKEDLLEVIKVNFKTDQSKQTARKVVELYNSKPTSKEKNSEYYAYLKKIRSLGYNTVYAHRKLKVNIFETILNNGSTQWRVNFDGD